MTKKLLFVVQFAMLFLAALTVSVSADQDGTSCWCNNDQYGCWITGEKGGRNYIMFRLYFIFCRPFGARPPGLASSGIWAWPWCS